jgi:hypothetical protein
VSVISSVSTVRDITATPGLGLPAPMRENDRDACERSAHFKEVRMAAMKPRTGDGPLEVTKEGRGIVMRVPLEGGGRLVVEMTPDEASALGDALKSVGN